MRLRDLIAPAHPAERPEKGAKSWLITLGIGLAVMLIEAMKSRQFLSFTRWLGVASLAAVALGGCGRSCVTRGADLYSQGNYIAAAEYFEHTEKRLSSASAEERARYAVFRGATLLALGDFEQADRWFDHAVEISRENPHALDADESQMLSRALRVRSDVASRAGDHGGQRHASNE